MQYGAKLTYRFNYSDTPAEKFPVRAVDIVNPEYNDDSSHLTYINKYNMKFQLIV